MSVKNRPKSSHYGPGMGLSALKQRDRRGGLGACQPPLAVDGDFDLDGESMSEDEDKESRKKSRFMVQTSTGKLHQSRCGQEQFKPKVGVCGWGGGLWGVWCGCVGIYR